MKLAIMQPYFMPYIGYFQLINAVDEFVVLDDVNYINRGWINRNRILINGQPKYITIPLKEAGQNKLIHEIRIVDDVLWKPGLLKTIEMNYKKAPMFEEVFALLKSILDGDENNLSKFVTNSIKKTAQYLSIDTKIIDSSRIFDKKGLKAEERILDICIQKRADIYINPIGGVGLYHKELFKENGIDLFFIETNQVEYKQLRSSEFVPYLSILDVLMNNKKDVILKYLANFGFI
ncbi:MAG: WbqC family protein [Prevotellaceae bacterium]|nr:WbqC family protein [Prevotellaceae bacterium]